MLKTFHNSFIGDKDRAIAERKQLADNCSDLTDKSAHLKDIATLNAEKYANISNYNNEMLSVDSRLEDISDFVPEGVQRFAFKQLHEQARKQHYNPEWDGRGFTKEEISLGYKIISAAVGLGVGVKYYADEYILPKDPDNMFETRLRKTFKEGLEIDRASKETSPFRPSQGLDSKHFDKNAPKSRDE